MSERMRDALRNPEIRRVFEEELLVGEATDTVAGLLESLGISQRELASRLGVTPARISQVLSGKENLTLRSLGALGWALGVRFELRPVAMRDRLGTPASDDPPPPPWLDRLQPPAQFTYSSISMPQAGRLRRTRPKLRVLGSGEVKAA
ncbi:MAG TPA: helix-turn-helix transcriptional regulator [Actinomycetota bacterium]|nr:helix-turn-helix transcriptional regulator [Actinomycetota bacterium]